MTNQVPLYTTLTQYIFSLDEESSSTLSSATLVTDSFLSNKVSLSKMTVTTENIYVTTWNDLKFPVNVSSTNLMSLKLRISAIGGIIALLLLIITLKYFSKTNSKRKERAHQLIYVKKESDQEDPYDETNETDGYLQKGNFHELKYMNSVSNESNEIRENNMQYQRVDETCVSSHISDLSSITVIENSSTT